MELRRLKEWLKVEDMHSLSRNEALELLTTVARLEKKTFPANEAFVFSPRLFDKANTKILVARSVADGKSVLVGYAVTVNHKGTTLLHKLCVAPAYRRRGFGRMLLLKICERSEEAYSNLQLWVDSANPARELYASVGFEERSVVPNYYSPGRTGVQMIRKPRY